MKIGWEMRIGIAGLILGLFSIAAFYLLPSVKAIGWLCLLLFFCAVVVWIIVEIRCHDLISKLLLTIKRWPVYSAILLALTASVVTVFGTYLIIGRKVPSLTVVTEPPPAPTLPFISKEKGKASGGSTHAAKTDDRNRPAARPVTFRPSPAIQVAPKPSQRPSGSPRLSPYSEIQNVVEEVNTKSRDWADGLDFCDDSYDQYVGMAGELPTGEMQSLKEKARIRYVLCVQQLLGTVHPEDRGLVEATVEDAIARMQMPGEKQITPNQASQLRKECEAALAIAEAGPSLEDLKPDKANRSRFKPLADYLTKLLKRLGDYRENPM